MPAIFYIRFNSSDISNHFNRLFKKLPSVQKSKVMSYQKQDDRFRTLLGRLLIAQCFSQTSYEILNFLVEDEFGKPYIPGKGNFNISHSGNLVVCAFSEYHKIGVDIEQITPVDISEFSYVLHSQELKEIQNASNSLDQFYRTWTKKEALIKAEGRGVSHPLETLDTTSASLQLGHIDWSLRIIPMQDGYITALASEITDQSPIELIERSVIKF